MADRISNLILSHWQRYHPGMLLWLQREDLLEQALEETAERFTDILYELTAVRKLEHHRAWELAMEEILLPEESTSTSSPKKNPPATSKSHQPTESGWAASMRKRAQT
jgi:hypothetical protein